MRKKYKHKDVILASFMKGKNWKLEYQQNIIVKGSVKYDYDRLLSGCKNDGYKDYIITGNTYISKLNKNQKQDSDRHTMILNA